MAASPIPEGCTALTPYLTVEGAEAALRWYREVLGAVELLRMEGPDGRIAHAEMAFDGARFMLADACPEAGAISPGTVGGTPVGLLLYVPDVDAVADRAVQAGARLLSPVEDMFYGDRMGTLEDPFGHRWHLATHREDVSEAEMRRRAGACLEAQGSAEDGPAL